MAINVNNVKSSNDIFGAFDALMADVDKKVKKVSEARDEARAQARENLLHDTTITEVMASRGFLGIMSAELDNPASIKAPQIRAISVSNKVAVLGGIAIVVQNAMKAENAKKHLVIYTQDSESIRVSGMLGRIAKGDDTVITEKEMAFISGRSDMGDAYVAVANKLFGVLKQAHDAGFTVRIMSNSSINAYDMYNRQLPEALAGKKVIFRNGVARVGSLLIRARQNLQGKHTLVKQGNNVVIEREVDKDKTPEQFTAGQMMSITAKTISVTAETPAEEEADAEA